MPDTTLSAEEQAAVASLPGSPTDVRELALVLEQGWAVAEFVASTIEASLGGSSMELTQKQAEKCLGLWLQLPSNFPWPSIEQKI